MKPLNDQLAERLNELNVPHDDRLITAIQLVLAHEWVLWIKEDGQHVQMVVVGRDGGGNEVTAGGIQEL